MDYEPETLEAIAARRIRYAFDKLHNAQGVYFLFDDDGELQYIGMSQSIRGRVEQHRFPNRPSLWPAPWFSHASWCVLDEYPRFRVQEIELDYIHAFKPVRNIKYTR